MNIEKLKIWFFKDSRKQDVLFLIGIFVFASILIIALLPTSSKRITESREFFVYTAMIVPIIAAIYFIIISFQRNLLNEKKYRWSIRKKFAISFLFVAILPSMLIVFASNSFFNRVFDKIIISDVFESRIVSTNKDADFYFLFKKEIESEANSLFVFLNKENDYISNEIKREKLKKLYELNKKKLLFFETKTKKTNNSVQLIGLDLESSNFYNDYQKIVTMFGKQHNLKVKLFSVKNVQTVVIPFFFKNYLVIMKKEFSKREMETLKYKTIVFKSHNNLETLLYSLKNDTGIYLLVLSIIVIAISLIFSLILSKSITMPIWELSKASDKIANGDLDVHLQNNDSSDEMKNLYISFNKMILELKQSKKNIAQKEKLEAWRDMAKRVVHEIKNPLTPIRLSAERMKRRYFEKHKDLDNIIRDGNDTIISEVEVLLNILKEFTQFARMPEVKKEQVDFNIIVKSTVDLFAGHENVDFKFDLDKELPLMKADKFLIKQALTNLVKNSIDAIGESGDIFIETKLIKGVNYSCLNLIVYDNGEGIETQMMNNLFEPGYSTKAGGSGLGLAIVKKIILDHGGTIMCNSKKGKGTEFIIELPLIV